MHHGLVAKNIAIKFRLFQALHEHKRFLQPEIMATKRDPTVSKVFNRNNMKVAAPKLFRYQTCILCEHRSPCKPSMEPLSMVSINFICVVVWLCVHC